MRLRTALLALAGLAAVGGGLAYFTLGRAIPVDTAAVTRGPAIAAIYATGVVEPVSWARLAPLTTGRLAAILARDGQTVTQDQPLAQLDDREAKARIAELEARERYWREELRRIGQLVERGFASRESRDRAQSELGALQAGIAQARQHLADLTLRAPIAGTVLRQDGEIGEVVDNRQVLFWIGQPRPLRITADVDEEDIPRVRPGQTALIKADAFPDRALPGTVAEITPKGDPVTKNYRVRIALPDDTPLLVGMSAEINLVERQQADALLIPAAALRDGRVWVVRDGRAQPQSVTPDIIGQSRVSISMGLAEGESVIVNPPTTLKPGQRVAPRPPPTAP